MPSARFYTTYELISPEREQSFFQSCGPGESFIDSCGNEYEDYLPLDHPVGFPSDVDAAVSTDVTLPLGNNRELATFSTDWLSARDFLKGWVVRVTHYKHDDPTWILGPIPYAISYGNVRSNVLTLTLQNPILLTLNGNLVQQYISEQGPRKELVKSLGF